MVKALLLIWADFSVSARQVEGALAELRALPNIRRLLGLRDTCQKQPPQAALTASLTRSTTPVGKPLGRASVANSKAWGANASISLTMVVARFSDSPARIAVCTK